MSQTLCDAAGVTTKRLSVAFIVGSDVTAHSIVNRITPALVAQGHSVHLMYTHGSPKKSAPRALRDLFFVEHTLLQEHAYPFVDRHGKPAVERANSPEGWRSLGNDLVHVHDVPKVNDPDFIDATVGLGLDLAISVRCYQRFKDPIITRLADAGTALLNLHPGLLPHYRGVLTSLRSMQDGAAETGFTLHHVEPEFDTGGVVDRTVCPLDYSRSVLENLALNYRSAADLLLGVVYDLSSGKDLPAQEQDHSLARYHSYAGGDDLDQLSERGIDLFRVRTVIDLICEVFGPCVPRPDELRQALFIAMDSRLVPLQR
jgi:methionyl-tRNA formyltransferase